MYKEYIKFILRQLSRNRIYTAINILGLGIALTAAFLIYNHVAKELSMDRFHKNGKDIYRITEKRTDFEQTEGLSVDPLAPAAKQEIPGIRDYARISPADNYEIKANKSTEFIANNQIIFTDPSFFKLFSFPLVSGTVPETTDKLGIVISRQTARKYFGHENPVGQAITLKIPRNNVAQEYYIRGIMEDIPATSSIQADVVINIATYSSDFWGGYSVHTFLLLDPNADIRSIEKAIPEMIERHYESSKASETSMRLQPLKELYFKSGHIEADKFLRGSPRLTGILCGITLLVLVLASCNYFMIKIAQMNRNFSGFAIQRCYGAGYRHIRRQLFTEVSIHILAALGIAVALAFFLHPYFVQIIFPQQPYPFTPAVSSLCVFVLLIMGFISIIGLLLYSYLIRRLNKNGIKNSIQTATGHFDVKALLTVTQIAIFCALLFCSAILSRQINYLKNKHLGFEKENILCFQWRDYLADIRTIKQEIGRNPNILSVTNGISLPLSWYNTWDLYIPEDPQNIIKPILILGDEDYTNTYQIKITEGRTLDPDNYPQDIKLRGRHGNGHCPEIIVNQQLVKKLKLQSPVGTLLWYKGEPWYRIVGVTEDFNYLPLYQQTKPMILSCDVGMWASDILIRYQPEKRVEVVSYLEEIFNKNFPNIAFMPQEYEYSEWYDKDITLANLIHIFTSLAILISGMGMFAFSMFMAESRRKEVALRKINGANEKEIIGLFNRGFVRRALLACAIGMPAAGYLMQKWLEGFAYRTTIEWWIIAGSITLSLLIVLAVTSWQIWKAATCNPVDSIKSE